MSLLAAVRLGSLAWSWRRTVVAVSLAALLLPLLMAAIVVEAQGGRAGGLAAPVRHAILTQPFGCTALDIEPSAAACTGHHFHSGIDLAGPLRSPIYAACEGTVQVFSQPGGYGSYMLVVRDARLTTLYAHLDTVLVRSGERVAGGQMIALMGSTGNSTGPHLHFEVRIAGVPVDPLPFLPGPAQGGDR